MALAGRAALIQGKSGSGKSDLALRCLMRAPDALVPLQAELVADDQVRLTAKNGRLRAAPPASLRGLIEVRGLGIVGVPTVADAELVLVVNLVAPDQVERLPDPFPRSKLLGIALPVIRLAPFEASAPLKLLLALHRLNSAGEITS